MRHRSQALVIDGLAKAAEDLLSRCWGLTPTTTAPS